MYCMLRLTQEFTLINITMARLSPTTIKRINKFKKIKRAYYALILLALIFVVTLAAELVTNNKPIVVYYNNHFYFPIAKIYPGTAFGLKSIFEPNYKKLKLTLPSTAWMVNPFIPWGYNESNQEVDTYPSPPSSANLLGTDDRGRDVLTRLLYGTRVSMFFALMNYLFALIIGILVGGMQGFFAGKVDLIGQRLVEMWSALPYFFVLILLGSLLQPGLIVLTIMSAFFSWIFLSYYMRAETLRVRNEEFVAASTSLGSGKIRNFFVHILPNSLTPIITFTPFIMAQGVLTLSFLDFLGFGVQAPTASIGELIFQGQQNFETAWWLAVFPVGTLSIITLLLNFVGEGLRRAFDPKKT